MARTQREEVPGGIHHAVAKGNGGAAIVADDRDRELFVSRLRETVGRHEWSCLAYCLLDTHVHLIVSTPHPNLGSGMKWLLGPYAQRFNWRHEREGHLFRGRFYSRQIKTQNHLIAAITYVALNPVRAGLVAQPEQWRWSSYSATVGRIAQPDFLDVEAVLELVDHDLEKARLRFERGVRENLAAERPTHRT
jgi:putative transposase